MASDIQKIRHSLSHLLAAAVLERFPKAKLGIGPAIEHGFYYDILFPRPLTPEDLPKLEARMRELARMNLPFAGKRVQPAAAKKLFKDQPFKQELVGDFKKAKKQITVYRTGDVFMDLCAGGHVKNTKEIPADGFALQRIAGAYWKGDEKNKMLTRIYGLAFPSKEELGAYRTQLEEAEKRDHKKLGAELDLFTFSDLVGGGLPLWTPRGTLMRNLLDSFVWELRKARGYEQVDIPHIAKKDLYETSGHWEKFKDDLLKIITREGHLFVMKPMNCPHHAQIYKRKMFSYRELPQRYANTTKVYRDEQSGELSGLSRVRSITQDDAHVFCRQSQVRGEIEKIWEIVETFYGVFGFHLSVRLSLRDPKNPKAYLGSPAVWKKAENGLRIVVKGKHIAAVEAPGEAAFYGPKIDFMGKDSLGREWQVATIQLDMNQPERFNLTCVNEDGKPERIVMIHAAIMGSIERFLSILIEHVAGAFPTWLAPVQARILPIADRHLSYANEVRTALNAKGIRVEVDESKETIGKKIRNAEVQKIPYMLIVGDREQEAKAVGVRRYGKGDLGATPLEAFVAAISHEVAQKK